MMNDALKWEDEEIRDYPLRVFDLEYAKIVNGIHPNDHGSLNDVIGKIFMLRELVDRGDLIFRFRSYLKESWIDYLCKREVEGLLNFGRHFDCSTQKVEMSDKAIPQNCHLIALLDWLENPSRKIFTGLVDERFAHSWTMSADETVLYEPTTAGWDGKYFGFEIAPFSHFLSIADYLQAQLLKNDKIKDRLRYKRIFDILRIADSEDWGLTKDTFVDLATWVASRVK